MSNSALFLLDTNIFLACTRQSSPISHLVESTYNLSRLINVPLISVITKGEILAIALRNGWQQKRRDTLLVLYANLVPVNIDRDELVEAYAEIQVYSQRQGRPMGENDVWIAATARVTQATLLTTDTDFDHLCPALLWRDGINPATLQIAFG